MNGKNSRCTNSIGGIIAFYRRAKGLSQAELSKELSRCGIDVSNKTISGWEKNRFEPSVTAFLNICRILDVPDVMEEYFGSNPGNPLASLNDEGKKKALSYIGQLLHPVSYAKTDPVIPYSVFAGSAKKTKKLRLYDIRVSAGTGNFLDSDFYTLVDVEEDKAGNADFAVTISGDSMEPKFHDHDMVLVHRQDALENGDIGIFALNGSAYIKKFENDEKGIFLISLNDKYKPVRVRPDTDALRIFGKVCPT